METLKNMPEIQKALDYLKEDDGRTLAETLELCQIPAPSGMEREKAGRVMEKMLEIGLSDVHMDEVGNVFGTIPGSGRAGQNDAAKKDSGGSCGDPAACSRKNGTLPEKNAPRLLLAAHTDTVFPADTDLTVRREGNRYFCPGINDDTRAIAEILSVARAMKAFDIHGEGDIVFCANVCEEGLGDLKGVKHIFHYDGKDDTDVRHGEEAESFPGCEEKDLPSVSGENGRTARRILGGYDIFDGFVSVDNVVPGGIIYTATGSLRYLVTFTGPGGHSFSDFGLPNPIHAMGRAIAAIADFQVKKLPKTTFNVGVVDGGTSVNSIPGKCSMLVDLRSDSPEELEKLSKRFFRAVNEAVEKENARWGYRKFKEEIKAGTETDVPAGNVRKERYPEAECAAAEKNVVKAAIEPRGVRPAGSQPKDAPIVRAAWDATLAAGLTPVFHNASSTDANIPISLGIPAVALGRSGDGGGTHTVHEWFEPNEAWRGPQKILLLILALSGYQGFHEYQLGRIFVNFGAQPAVSSESRKPGSRRTARTKSSRTARNSARHP